jgi:hypothetical protein
MMHTGRAVAVALAVLLGGIAGGCGESDMKAFGDFWKFEKSTKPARKVEAPAPADVEGTVGEFAGIAGGGGLLVDGHGLVVGLGKNGSGDAPPTVKEQIVQYMLKMKVGSPTHGTAGATPSEIIADKDTAVVRFVGAIPPGAPAGYRFDVNISALSRTSTKSLDGGILLPWSMYMAAGEGSAPEARSREWARAQGSVFINPFLEPDRPSDAPRFREGRLIGGATCRVSRPLSLALQEPDYQRCDMIQRRINQRFGEREKVAFAKSSSVVEIKIPPEYAQDYQHFIEMVLHLPLQGEAQAWEVHARQIAREMEQPGANYDGLAMVWEAMGPQIIGVCRGLYASRNVAAAFHAARAGARLGDDIACDVLLRHALSRGSPYQVAAIEELGRHRRFARCVTSLRPLVDDDSDPVRVAAYEALQRLGDTRTVARLDVAGEFTLDLVSSQRNYIIYATQSIEKRIVLFGREMEVVRKMFFSNHVITLWDRPDPNGGGSKLRVFRTIPRTGGISEAFELDFKVRTLLETLANPAELDEDGSRVKGLGLTYGQVVAVLQRMCDPKTKDIPAKFVLQRPRGERKIYAGTATIGRPDMPED